MTAAGYAKNGDGLWAKDGKTINCHDPRLSRASTATSPRSWWRCCRTAASTPASTSAPTPIRTWRTARPGFYMFGHGASLKDPYAALELFHGRFSNAIGTTAGNNRFSRYKNPEFDAILDQMAPLASDDPKFKELGAQGARRSTGAIRSTSRSSSGCTASPTTRPTGRTGRPRPTWPWAPTARSGRRPGMLVITNLQAAQAHVNRAR